MNLDFQLMSYQEDFVFDTTHEEQGFKGGFRAGKSESAVHKAIYLSAIHAGTKGALLSPTYGMTKRNLVPIFKRLNQKYNLGIRGLTGQNPTILYLQWGKNVSEIHLDISAENHDRLNGISLSWAGLDEADKCNSAAVAQEAWMQMGSRLSEAVPGQVGVRFATSTPEGFGFMFSTFAENLHEDKILYTASMLDNYMLPKSYIEMQRRTLPKHLFGPYINGDFTNLNKNIVYQDYDRVLNDTQLTLADMKPGEVLHMGMDFNQSGMSAIGFIYRNNDMFCVYENIGATNTKALGLAIKNDARLTGKTIIVYPDPACNHMTSNSDSSDLMIIKSLGFNCRYMSAAPYVNDRINSVNAKFCNINDKRSLFVNTRTCPLLVKALMQQIYNSSGTPQKNELLIGTAHTYIDGPVDALGYPTFMLYPVMSSRANKVTIQGF